MQVIASILSLKARTVKSAETRAQLENAHKRVISVAAVQKYLHAANAAGSIEVGPYLTQLCSSLSAAVVNEDQCEIKVHAPERAVPPNAAVSIGLIVTELVLNALNHAFPDSKTGCAVVVNYEVNGSDWRLTVSDNGVGKNDVDWPPKRSGLGTGIIQALAGQLDARVDVKSGPGGTTVFIAHSTFQPRSLGVS